MFGNNVLKTEFVGEENGVAAINCLLDNYIHSIDCSIAIDDEFGTEEDADENDERNEWEIRDDENNINWLLEKLRSNGEKWNANLLRSFITIS